MTSLISFEILEPTPTSGRFAYSLRQDPEVRKQSLTFTIEEPFEVFYPRFLSTHFTIAHLPPLAVIIRGERAGLLRFNRALESHSVEVSIVLERAFRGQGFGKEVIARLNSLFKEQAILKGVARIKKENIPSQKSFEANDWVKVRQEGALFIYEKKFTERDPKLFFIAEAGSNWKSFDGGDDLTQAKKLIDVAHAAGADAVKFQIFRAKNTYVKEAGKSRYLKGEPEIFSLFEALEMPYEMIPRLAEYTKEVGIEFMATVFSEEDLHAVDPYVKRHKVASYENCHFPLLKALAKTKKPLLISTGATTATEIQEIIAFLTRDEGADITLLQCTACYPAPAHAMHLSVIPSLKERFHCKVGLSDHSLDPYAAPLTALALGASVIEKHFTLSKSLTGPDHRFAIEPSELTQLIKSLREAEKMFQNWEKEIDPVEIELRQFAKRSLQAICDIEPGDIFQQGVNFALLRPGENRRGSEPAQLFVIEGRRATRKIKAGEGIP